MSLVLLPSVAPFAPRRGPLGRAGPAGAVRVEGSSGGRALLGGAWLSRRGPARAASGVAAAGPSVRAALPPGPEVGLSPGPRVQMAGSGVACGRQGMEEGAGSGPSLSPPPLRPACPAPGVQSSPLARPPSCPRCVLCALCGLQRRVCLSDTRTAAPAFASCPLA